MVGGIILNSTYLLKVRVVTVNSVFLGDAITENSPSLMTVYKNGSYIQYTQVSSTFFTKVRKYTMWSVEVHVLET